MRKSVSRFRFGYVMGLMSVSKLDLPPSLAREFFWVGFDSDLNGTFRNMSRFPTYVRNT